MIGIFELILLGIIVILSLKIWNQNKNNLEEKKTEISKYDPDKDKKFILDEIEDQFIALNKLNIIEYANPSANKRFGNNLKNKHLGTILRNPELDNLINDVKKNNKTNFIDLEISLPSYQHYRIYAIPGPTMLFPDQESVVLFLKDLTEISKAQQFRTDFVANVSHELRTPLMSIKGAVETIQGPAKDDEPAKKKFLDIMNSQTLRMESLISDLLILSRIELEEHIRPSETVFLEEVFNKVKAIHVTNIDKNKINLKINISQKFGKIIGNEERILTVFSNLIDNSIKYSEKNKSIEVFTSESVGKFSKKGVKISIIDQGIGIPEDQIVRITERFYRVDVEKSKRVGGTGLGLAIMKHIIAQHRGEFEIKSKIGKGTEVHLHLPSEL